MLDRRTFLASFGLLFVKPQVWNLKLSPFRNLDGADKYIKTLMYSIMFRGLVVPIIISPEGIVICGNLRVLACRRLGMKTIKATIVGSSKIIEVPL